VFNRHLGETPGGWPAETDLREALRKNSFVCISIFVEGIRSLFFSAAMILPLPAILGTGTGMVP